MAKWTAPVALVLASLLGAEAQIGDSRLSVCFSRDLHL